MMSRGVVMRNAAWSQALRRVGRLGIAICLAVGLLAGCDEGAATSGRSSSPMALQIAVVGPGGDSPAWDVLRSVAGRVVGEKQGAHVTYFSPANRTPAAQQEELTKVLEGQFDAVCLLVLDPKSLQKPVNDLVDAGKRVVLLGVDIPESRRHMFVGPSELEIGEAAAEAAERVLPADRRTVMLLHAGVSSPIYGSRYAAFKARLATLPGAELFKELNCDASGVKGQQIMRRQSRLYPRLGGWVLLDDWPLRVADPDASLVPLGCSLILCCDHPRYFKAVRDGRVDALITYDFHQAVAEAIRSTLRLAEDRSNAMVDHYIVDTEIVTKDEIDWHSNRWSLWRKGIASEAREAE